MTLSLDNLYALLESTRFHYTTEADLQNGVEQLLIRDGIRHNREHRFDGRSRIDFYLPDVRLGIEVKIAGSLQDIARQVQRYLQRPELDALIVLSRRHNVAAIPDTVAGKPVRTVILWRNGL